MANPASQKLLSNQLMQLEKSPVKGFKVELIDESNLYEWKVYIEGPPDTPYDGGIFQAHMKFPYDYPFSPPSIQFVSDFWHPNVYKDGKVCISILHPPGNDPYSGERPEERWLPTQTPETILLSVISLLSDPNIGSAANVDASVEWRDKRGEYVKRVKKLVDKAKSQIPKDFEMPKETKPPAPKTPSTEDYYFDGSFEIEQDDDDDDDEEDDEDYQDEEHQDDDDDEDLDEEEEREGVEEEEKLKNLTVK